MAKLTSCIDLMVDYLHIEGLGPTDPREKLLSLQSRFEKAAQKLPFLRGVSTKSPNFTTCKFVNHSPTLTVPAKIMLDHSGKCQEQKHVFFRNPYLAPIWPLWTPLKWSLGGRNPWKLPTPKFYGKWTITSCRINIFGRWGREALSPFYSKRLLSFVKARQCANTCNATCRDNVWVHLSTKLLPRHT